MKRYNPLTPSRRHMTTIPYGKILTASEPQKSLTYGNSRKVGRNNLGRITVRHKGGGHKRLYRDIDFRMDKVGVPGTLKTIEYDPNRSGFIGLVFYKDGDKRYLLLPRGMKPGNSVITAENAPIAPGNRLPLKNIIVGTFVYNVELKVGGGAKLARSAGNFAEVVARDA